MIIFVAYKLADIILLNIFAIPQSPEFWACLQATPPMELAIRALVCFCIGSVAVFGSYWVRSSSTAPANTDRACRGPPPSHATAAPRAPTAARAGISLSPLPIFSLGSRRRQLGHSDKRAPRVAPGRPRIPSLHDNHPSFRCRARASPQDAARKMPPVARSSPP